jgi:hypothetical protein
MFRQFIKSTSAQLPKRSVAQWQRIVVRKREQENKSGFDILTIAIKAQPIVTRNMTAAVGNTVTRFVRTYSTTPQVSTGKKEVHEFKTETKRLLDIVANSLYSEKEIFVRYYIITKKNQAEQN